MEILKRENWWIWLIITLVGQEVAPLVIGALVGVYDKNAWYAKWYYWVIGLICLIFPAIVMFMVFIIQITALTAYKLEVPGSELYLSPYIWLLCFIIPIIGWICLSVLLLYLPIMIIVKLYQGKGEQYIK